MEANVRKYLLWRSQVGAIILLFILPSSPSSIKKKVYNTFCERLLKSSRLSGTISICVCVESGLTNWNALCDCSMAQIKGIKNSSKQINRFLPSISFLLCCPEEWKIEWNMRMVWQVQDLQADQFVIIICCESPFPRNVCAISFLLRKFRILQKYFSFSSF